MLRRLVDYKKLDHAVAALLIDTYPHGYGDEDIIAFRNSNGDFIEAVELKTVDTIYLVKISKSLSNFISNFDENIEKELKNNIAPIPEVSEMNVLEPQFKQNTEGDFEL